MTRASGHDGTTIAYTDTGEPPGRPDAPMVVFGPQIAALRDRYRCVSPPATAPRSAH